MTAPTVYPCLTYRDAPAAIDWLCDAFGFSRNFVADGPGGKVAHAELGWSEGGVIMLGSAVEDNADIATGRSLIYLAVSDPDEHFARATAAGAEVVRPPKDEDYGSRGYTLRDPEGHIWSFGTYRPGG
ncbi:VOC family protein [Spirillospora sp. CA-294931]|uniref:VOC family protein n=1 Tax=Spirillospora sp. CA-294931 TaxID=3240042 RepID=UPI003D8A0117